MSLSCKYCTIPTLSDINICDKCNERRLLIANIIEEWKDSLSSAEIANMIMEQVTPVTPM